MVMGVVLAVLLMIMIVIWCRWKYMTVDNVVNGDTCSVGDLDGDGGMVYMEIYCR